MYVKSLHIYEFKCFHKAKLELMYPDRKSTIPNVNVILGDNGGGKSSILRALALAVLSPILLGSGFVPYRLVRRQAPGTPPVSHCFLKIKGKPNNHEKVSGVKNQVELLARLDQSQRGNLDKIYLDNTPESPLTPLMEDDFSPAFFIVGYGATRRVETGDYSASSARRSRGLRYQRIASLFEDHVALRPLTSWLNRLERGSQRFFEAVKLISQVLPPNINFKGEYLYDDEQYAFEFEGVVTPFNSLSDGYKAFIAWIGDLVGHLVDVVEINQPLESVSGIVLVDEIDLHLHPSWQRDVIPLISRSFPRLQFVFTSHSPLVAASVKSENLFVTVPSADGTSKVEQFKEKVHYFNVEHVLLSSYFGLTTTRSQEFEGNAEILFKKISEGDSEAALEFLKKMAPL